MPELTIGLPVYNSERYIGEVLECLLAQSYGSFRVLISDNASTDATPSLCQEFARRDKRISYVRHPQNLGATVNYNYVALHADTTYFKWHSSNDLLSSNALQSCIDMLDGRPDIALAFPHTRLFQHSTETSTPYDADPIADQEDPIERFLYVIDNMALNNMMNGVLRLDYLRRTAMLRTFYSADRGMMAELALQGKLLRDEGSTFFRRMDEHSATQKKSAKEVLRHFDPRWKRPLSFMTWRTFGAYLVGLSRAGIGPVVAFRGYAKVLRRAWWGRNQLAEDVADYLVYLGRDLRRIVPNNSK